MLLNRISRELINSDRGKVHLDHIYALADKPCDVDKHRMD